MVFFTFIYIHFLHHLIELCVLNEYSSHNSVFLTILMKIVLVKLVVLRVLGGLLGRGVQWGKCYGRTWYSAFGTLVCY